jgi:sulfate adenylyltransferase subunit 1
LKDDIDISRGDSIVLSSDQPKVVSEVEALICWLDEKPLVKGNKYILQHNSRRVRASVKDIFYKLDVNTLEQIDVDGNVKLNEVVKVSIKTASPLVADAYADLPSNGAAILIDETSNSTVGSGSYTIKNKACRQNK